VGTARPLPAAPAEVTRSSGLDPARVSGLADHLRVFLLAALVGVLAGLCAIGFQKLTDLARDGFFSLFGVHADKLLDGAMQLSWWQRLILPAIGAALAATLLYRVFRRKGSYGVADIMESVSLRRGDVKLSDVLARGVSTAAVIGSGGSTGREGPIIQIGAAIASFSGRFARVPPRDLSVLIACGAAAGMAGAYNAPIGAAMFVMEVILGSFVMEQFAPVIVASVTSTFTVRAVVGDDPIYRGLKDLKFEHIGPWMAIPIFVLGVFAALAGWGFLRSLTFVEDRMSALRLPRGARAVLAGLLVGALGIGVPEVWGNGYDAVSDRILPVAVGIDVLLLLLVSKVAATAITSGGGVSGGVFTPTLFIGAALGGAYGIALHRFFPGVDPKLFALIGMGSVLAATTHAPLMSILILFEMTRDPALIAPLMLGGVTATLFARFIHADSLYTARLKRRGVRLPEGAEESALLRTYARDLVRTDAPVLAAHSPLDHVLDVFLNSRSDALYVVADGGRYVGVARIHDVKSAFASHTDGGAVIALDVAVPVPPIPEDEAIGQALARFQDSELDEVPVVASADDPRFVGSLSRRDILAMLRHEVLVEPSRPARIGTRSAAGPAYLDLPPGWRLTEAPVSDELAGRPLDVDAWRRDRGETPLVVLRSDGAGTRTPTAPDAVPLRVGDVVVVVGPAR
jgi:chloride channel protein, CIC family